MRSDESYFLDMLIAAQNIQQFTAGLTQEEFEASKLHQSAVIREMQVIGEASRSISQDMKVAHPEINWGQIAGMRNRVIHEYFRIDEKRVWEIVMDDIGVLIEQLKPLIPSDTEE